MTCSTASPRSPTHDTAVADGTRSARCWPSRWPRCAPAASIQPGKPWKVEHDFPVTPAPAYVWDYFAPPVAPRIIGSQSIGGHPTRIVAFFGRSGQVPVRFRLWVGQGGLVRRGQMLAQGHFMDHDYHGFDAPTAILPPQR